MNDPSYIRLRDVAKSFGMPSSQVHALRGVSFDIGQGERVALLGKSGSGKSTLLNLIGGLDRPTSGRIVVGEHDLATLTSNQLARFRSTTVGMVFQSFNLIATRTAIQNVTLPMIFAGTSLPARRMSGESALESVGLGERLQHRPNELSGGEHQRVAIARALVNNPQIVLADEPTGNLDTVTANEIVDILENHLNRHNTTLILVTHDEDLARRCATRILRLQDGRLVG
ncbi:MAG TPA: ABC transporter ATP-binding protein [Gemmataceae bacterium]|nr:ABC transporter ATP-binding protein [Gemmataceae bacterium]